MSSRHMNFPFDILWVAKKCGLLEGKMAERGEEICIKCPLDGCNDTAMHLSLNIAKDTWNCVHCGTGGGMIDLYKAVYHLDTKSATKELYTLWRGLSSTQQQQRRSWLTEKKQAAPTEIIAPIERRDTAYRALLSYLEKQNENGLTDQHRTNLMQRGLTITDIERLGFKSFNLRGKKIVVPSHLDTTDVAGFYTCQNCRLVNTDLEGFLIPYQDLYGRIGMLEIRMFGEGKRYMRFASGKPVNGRSECTKSPSVIHHVGIDIHHPPQKVYLTEGALKADVANALTGKPFIAMPGVNNRKGLDEALKGLQGIGVQIIVLAFDMDLYSNPAVLKGLKAAAELVQSMGIQIKMAKWDTNFKGIDDFYWQQIKATANVG